MKNDYEIRGNVTAIILKSPKYGRLETLINTEDLEKAQKYTNTWTVAWSYQTFYCIGMLFKDGKQINIPLHRWITDAPSDKFVDHINHNTLDNRKQNLRILTNAENQQNRKGATVKNKSGVRGVSWEKTRKKWRVQVMINGKSKSIGCFNTINEAESAAVAARRKLMPFSKEATATNKREMSKC